MLLSRLASKVLLTLTATVATLTLVLAVPQAALADPYPISSSANPTWIVRGNTVNVTVTFTNPEPLPVTFVYLSVNPTYSTINQYQVLYGMTGCSGEITWCETGGGGAALHFAAPIAANESRTVSLTYAIAPDSNCDGNTYIAFYFYAYWETATGAADAIVGGPSTYVACWLNGPE